MKTELSGQISTGARQGRASVRQRCASVAALSHALETRMFPHFCMFRQRRQRRFQPSLEIKEDRREGEEEKREERKRTKPTLATLATLAEPLSMRVSAQPDPGATLAQRWRTGRKTELNPPDAGPLNKLRLSKLTKPGPAP